MNVINEIFERMDLWRNLPNYQLERRADLFFSVYLKQAIEQKYQKPLKDLIIPEFPIHIASLCPNNLEKIDNRSCKVDYVAFSKDNLQCFFIELKTDDSSRKNKQDKYLLDAANTGLKRLIQGLIKIFKATDEKRKYFHLFKMLEDVEMIELPKPLQSKLFSVNPRGITKQISEIKILGDKIDTKVIYIQPTLPKSDNIRDIITFNEFAQLIAGFEDPSTRRFCESLKRWSYTKAGDLIR